MAELDELLQTVSIVPDDDTEHGYRIQRIRQPLLRHPRGVANAGLAKVAQYALLLAGHEVHLERPPVCELVLPVDTGPWGKPTHNPHLLRFVKQHNLGVISHQLKRRESPLVAIEIVAAFPGIRIGFVCATESDLSAFCSRLRELEQPFTASSGNRVDQPGQRLVVATAFGLANSDVLCDCDVLVFLDAAAAVGERGQLAMLGNGHARIFGMLREGQHLPPRIRDLVMAAFGPDEVTLPRLGYQNRQIEVAWARIKGGQSLSACSTAYEVYRDGITHNTLRNRRMSRLANGLLNNDVQAVRHICPQAVLPSSGNACKTAVIVANVDHAIELARRLDWPFAAGEVIDMHGLPAFQRVIVEGRWKMPLIGGRVIATVAGLEEISLQNFDAVIWAAGGMGLPEVPRKQIICPAGDDRHLLWIDFDDHQHSQLRRASASRRRAYTAAGWFPAGTPPVVGRIERFLSQRPGAHR